MRAAPVRLRASVLQDLGSLDEDEQYYHRKRRPPGSSGSSGPLFGNPNWQRPSERPGLVRIAKVNGWPGYFGAPRSAGAAMGAQAFELSSQKLNEAPLQILDGLGLAESSQDPIGLKHWFWRVCRRNLPRKPAGTRIIQARSWSANSVLESMFDSARLSSLCG